MKHLAKWYLFHAFSEQGANRTSKSARANHSGASGTHPEAFLCGKSSDAMEGVEPATKVRGAGFEGSLGEGLMVFCNCLKSPPLCRLLQHLVLAPTLKVSFASRRYICPQQTITLVAFWTSWKRSQIRGFDLPQVLWRVCLICLQTWGHKTCHLLHCHSMGLGMGLNTRAQPSSKTDARKTLAL